MRPSRLEVVIDELVLHGFSDADRLRIGLALETELGRIISERGLPEGLVHQSHRDVVDAGSIESPAAGNPWSLGGRVAGAVYGGLGR